MDTGNLPDLVLLDERFSQTTNSVGRISFSYDDQEALSSYIDPGLLTGTSWKVEISNAGIGHWDATTMDGRYRMLCLYGSLENVKFVNDQEDSLSTSIEICDAQWTPNN